jgi:N-acetylglucosaminyl-diphospho-decaprenol L-rhamnosyltransferase
MNKIITLAFLSYHSAHHIKRIVKTLDKKFNIIIIENSSDFKLKKEIENRYKNVQVKVCSKNLGFSKAMNLAIKMSKTQYVFLNPSDVVISNNLINSLLKIVKNFDKFGLLTPSYKDRRIHSNYFVWNKDKKKNLIIKTNKKKFLLKEVDFIDGTILVNKKIIKKNLFDENFFIYYEVMDYSKRLIDKGIKLYACPSLKFEHFGGQSHNKEFNLQANIFRNWHYNWSKFYYFKKHYNYFFALKKLLPNFIRALKNFLSNFINSGKDSKIQKILAMYEMRGIVAAILLKKSNFRINYKSKINL